jgi:anti-sigma regulatory factor (Ser/Thr protein kinase)
LQELVEAAAREGQLSASAIVEGMLEGEDPADDVALLVVEALEVGPLSLDLDAEASQLAGLRRKLRPWLRGQGLDEQESHDVLVAVDEAAANAIEHPRDPRSAVFHVEGDAAADELVIRVSDSGRWREQVERGTRGRGLDFMRKLMADVQIYENDDGTQVVLRRPLPARVSSRA